jgi:paraquat-inducible protein B
MAGITTDKTRLGVFVVSGLVLAVAGVLALGAGRLFEKTAPVHCYFAESVQGLEKGSPISYRGVLVGRVESITMMRPAAAASADARGPHQGAIIAVRGALLPSAFQEDASRFSVEAEVRKTVAELVSQGLRVRLAWKDITGQKYLDLDYHDPAEAVPPKLPVTPEEPYIPTYVEPSLQDIQKDLASTLAQISKIRFGAIGEKIETLLERVTTRVEELRTDEISAALREASDGIRKLTESGELQRGLERVDAITRETERATARLNEILQKPELDAAAADLAAAAKSARATVERLEARVPETVERFDALLAEASRAVVDAKLPETMDSLRGGADGIAAATRSVVAMRAELISTMRELGQASRSVGRLADFLERHPEAVLSGRAGEGGKP